MRVFSAAGWKGHIDISLAVDTGVNSSRKPPHLRMEQQALLRAPIVAENGNQPVVEWTGFYVVDHFYHLVRDTF